MAVTDAVISDLPLRKHKQVMTSSGMLIISILYVVILIHCIQASIFDYEVIDGEGNSINLSKYQDKKVIIIGIIY